VDVVTAFVWTLLIVSPVLSLWSWVLACIARDEAQDAKRLTHELAEHLLVDLRWRESGEAVDQ
jgi:hypothetical protein